MTAILKLVATLALGAFVATACDTAEELAADSLPTGSLSHGGQGGLDHPALKYGAPLTLLPQNMGDESPACLDGSPYGFYFNPSTSNSTKWTISIEGGGWCYDEVGCLSRSKMNLGSSKGWAPEAGCGCMNAANDGLDKDCNCLYMPYGDGASFSGFRREVWPVPGGGNLTFRGIKNFDATMEWALRHGLDKATEFVLTGGSAGGLSTFLHADRIAAKIRAAAPSIKKIVAAPVVGYFLDHQTFANPTGSQGTPNQPDWGQSSYTARMEYIYGMQNMTFGEDGALAAACKAKHPESPGLCFMSPHMQDAIKTPFFMFNSKFDAWQLGNELETRWEGNTTEQAAVLQYGKDFLAQFAPVQAEGKNGAMITSCICHGCSWSSLTTQDGGLNSYQHYAAWYNGSTTGAASVHIDTRGPNGDGDIKDTRCSKWP